MDQLLTHQAYIFSNCLIEPINCHYYCQAQVERLYFSFTFRMSNFLASSPFLKKPTASSAIIIVGFQDAYKASKVFRQVTGTHGLLVLKKSVGKTSSTTLEMVKNSYVSAINKELTEALGPGHRLNHKEPFFKLGHAGKLDSTAEGVLLCGIGKGTKMLNNLINCDKTYDATVTFGAKCYADVMDVSTAVLDTKPYDHITMDAIRKLCEKEFHGEIMQKPPAISSVKVGGKTYHELSNRQKLFEEDIPERMVKIYSLKLHGYTAPDLELTVECSKGFYVRSLARDLGLKLDSYGSLKWICRTKQSIFELKDCITPEEASNLRTLKAHVSLATDRIKLSDPELHKIMSVSKPKFRESYDRNTHFMNSIWNRSHS